MLKWVVACGLIAAGWLGIVCEAASAEKLGTFIGEVVTRWEDDGRRMTLMEPIKFVDGSGRSWRVPRGVLVDGASIPSIFWSFIGGPFEGKYRNASIIHDYFCEVRTRKWEEVHRVFFEGMLASGVGLSRARLIYEAVNRFGPRWAPPKVDPKCLKQDGSIDLSKCTENSAVSKTEVTFPKAGAAELNAFLNDAGKIGDPEDVRALREAVGR
ncbi:MAG: DUF1353 domain-containing protein [Hyphomicrobium sp.]|jgi:hypothetical protein